MQGFDTNSKNIFIHLSNTLIEAFKVQLVQLRILNEKTVAESFKSKENKM